MCQFWSIALMGACRETLAAVGLALVLAGSTAFALLYTPSESRNLHRRSCKVHVHEQVEFLKSCHDGLQFSSDIFEDETCIPFPPVCNVDANRHACSRCRHRAVAASACRLRKFRKETKVQRRGNVIIAART